MAVGIIVGVAFSAIVNSIVKDILMPPIGLVLGKIDFSNLAIVLKQGSTPGPYDSLVTAQAAGAVTSNFGTFINLITNFLIIATVVFFLYHPPTGSNTGSEKSSTTHRTNNERLPLLRYRHPYKGYSVP